MLRWCCASCLVCRNMLVSHAFKQLYFLWDVWHFGRHMLVASFVFKPGIAKQLVGNFFKQVRVTPVCTGPRMVSTGLQSGLQTFNAVDQDLHSLGDPNTHAISVPCLRGCGQICHDSDKVRQMSLPDIESTTLTCLCARKLP